MSYKDRIILDANILLGKPVIKGTRIPVDLLLKRLSEGMTIDDLLEAYPKLSKDDIYSLFSYPINRN